MLGHAPRPRPFLRNSPLLARQNDRQEKKKNGDSLSHVRSPTNRIYLIVLAFP